MAEWTEAHINRLKELWAEGISASNIVAKMNWEFSRSAILGKVNRLNLRKRRAGTVREPHHKPQPAKPKPHVPRAPPPKPIGNTASIPLPPPPLPLPLPTPVPPPIKKARFRNVLPSKFYNNVFFNDWIANLAPRLRNIYRIPKVNCCKFIIGEVASPSSYWCAKPVVVGGSWCPYHKKLVYQPPGTYRRNKR